MRLPDGAQLLVETNLAVALPDMCVLNGALTHGGMPTSKRLIKWGFKGASTCNLTSSKQDSSRHKAWPGAPQTALICCWSTCNLRAGNNSLCTK
jgi:hypothetical protein